MTYDNIKSNQHPSPSFLRIKVPTSIYIFESTNKLNYEHICIEFFLPKLSVSQNILIVTLLHR